MYNEVLVYETIFFLFKAKSVGANSARLWTASRGRLVADGWSRLLNDEEEEDSSKYTALFSINDIGRNSDEFDKIK